MLNPTQRSFVGAVAAAAIGPDFHSELEVTEDFPTAIWGILVKARWEDRGETLGMTAPGL